MNIFKNISNGYKKIATGIAIVSFLAIVYIALIPGGTLAQIYSASGIVGGAQIKIVEYPQYNTTSNPSDGTYSIPNVPYGTYNLRVRATGLALNTTQVTVDASTVTQNIFLIPGERYIAGGQIYSGQWGTEFIAGNLGNKPTTYDVNFINLAGVTKNSSEDVISANTAKGYKWSKYVTDITGDLEGSGTISSEQKIDVITLQRSNSAGKLGFFEGTPLNLDGTQWFMPGLLYGGQWRSGFKVLNLGNSDADVTMNFYDINGNPINTRNIIIPPKASQYYDWYTNGYVAGGSIPSSADGTATIVSNNAQPLNVVASQASELQGSLGLWNGIYLNDLKTDVFVTGQLYNGPWRSGFKVANLDSTDANVSMYFYDVNGALINTKNVTIAPKASPYYDWNTYGYIAGGSIPSSADGTVRVVSNLGHKIYITESQASENPGILDFYPAVEINGNMTAGLIYLKLADGERSGFKIANPSDSPITATIKFYNATGTLVNTILNSNIPAKSSPYYAWASYTSEPSGSITVEASDRISVIANFASNNEAKLGIYKGVKEQ